MFSILCKQNNPFKHNMFVYYIIFLQMLLFSLTKYDKQNVFMKIFKLSYFVSQPFSTVYDSGGFMYASTHYIIFIFQYLNLYLLIFVSKENLWKDCYQRFFILYFGRIEDIRHFLLRVE